VTPAGVGERLVTVLLTLAVPEAADSEDAAALVADAAQSTALQVRHTTGVEGHQPTPGATVVRAVGGSPGRSWRSPPTRCDCGTWPGTSLKSPGAASARTRWTPRSACLPNHWPLTRAQARPIRWPQVRR